MARVVSAPASLGGRKRTEVSSNVGMSPASVRSSPCRKLGVNTYGCTASDPTELGGRPTPHVSSRSSPRRRATPEILVGEEDEDHRRGQNLLGMGRMGHLKGGIVRIVSADELATMSADIPQDRGQLRPHWLEGPFTSDRLDVGLVTLSPGGVTPPHTHVGGQVIVVTAGRGFIETGGERSIIEPGDVVICPPGELHVHGALGDEPMAHLTVTTAGYTFPAPPEG